MSHITEVKVNVKDLESLREAAEACGFEFLEGQMTHEWYGAFVDDSETGRQFARERGVGEMGKCLHALRLKDHKQGDYEIGVIASKDGDGYELVYDTWGPGRRLESAAGAGLSRLRREYSAAVVTKNARRDRFSVQRRDLPGGRIQFRLKKR